MSANAFRAEKIILHPDTRCFAMRFPTGCFVLDFQPKGFGLRQAFYILLIMFILSVLRKGGDPIYWEVLFNF